MTDNQIEKYLPLGILSWYPWEKGDRVLCEGIHSKNFRDFLQTQGIIADIEDTCDSSKKYDYIIIFNKLEYVADPLQALNEWKQKLKQDGHLFLAIENRLGLRFFCGDRDKFTLRNYDGIYGYRDFSDKEKNELGGRNYARYEIEQFLDQVGLSNRKFYSVLPGLEMPQQIYAENYLPEEDLVVRYTPLYHSPSTVFLEEKYLYTSLVKNGMFHQMANAYLIDCTLMGDIEGIKHVTVSMDRGERNSLATIIWENGIVTKKAIFDVRKERLKSLVYNTDSLRNRGIATVPLTLTEKGCEMPYIQAETARDYLCRLIFEDKNKYIEEVDRFINCIKCSSEPVEGSLPNSGMGPYFKKVYLDMVPLNCFHIDGEYVFFDQEFCEENYPINVVIMRTLDILYQGDKRMEQVVPMSFFIDRYMLTSKMRALNDKGIQYIQKIRNQDELVQFNHKHSSDVTVVNMNRQRMNYSNQEYIDTFINLLKNTENKKIYIFGSGMWARKFIAWFGNMCKIEAALDNNVENWGRTVDGIEICTPQILKNLDPDDYKVIICIKQYAAVLKQIMEYGTKYYGIYDPHIEYPMNTIFNKKVNTIEQKNSENRSIKKYKVGYIAGVFDLFHIGHLNMFKRAKEQCEYLMVGVVSDEGVIKNKSVEPFITCKERVEMVQSCKYVDEAFELPFISAGTKDIFRKYHFDVQFSGSDYEKDPMWLKEQAYLREQGADLVFFPYTESTSSSQIKNLIQKKLM